MELKGEILEIHTEKEINGLKERILTIKSEVKSQILDIYCYNRNSFLSGFLLPHEKVNFEIVLQDIQSETKRETDQDQKLGRNVKKI